MRLSKQVYELKKLMKPKEDTIIYVGWDKPEYFEELEKVKSGEIKLIPLEELINSDNKDWDNLVGFYFSFEVVI